MGQGVLGIIDGKSGRSGIHSMNHKGVLREGQLVSG